MKVWIEVSSDYRFDKKVAGESGLVAPASNRYINMMNDVKKDDIILHYIIKQRAKKEHESRIIAISKAKSVMQEESLRIAVDLKEIVILPVPVTLKEIKEMKNKSANLKKLIRMSFLRYLTEISVGDLKNILKIYRGNMEFLEAKENYKKIIKKFHE
jgi:hypothetical protein